MAYLVRTGKELRKSRSKLSSMTTFVLSIIDIPDTRRKNFRHFLN